MRDVMWATYDLRRYERHDRDSKVKQYMISYHKGADLEGFKALLEERTKRTVASLQEAA